MYRIKIKDFDLAQIEESGQCFRFIKCDKALILKDYKNDVYRTIVGDRYLEAVNVENDVYDFSCSEAEFNKYWFDYFDLATDYSKFKESINQDDLFLKRAVEYGYGIRILVQDKWEMLVSFIISQRKSIPAIRSCIESLCQAFGQPIYVDGQLAAYSFPSPESFASHDIEELKAHGVGYRDKYIMKLARDVVEGRIDVEGLGQLPAEKATEELLKIFGIGIKVANCVSLFGLHNIDAFPIDVWINRIIFDHYNGHFDTEEYKGYAGVIQQYMFYYVRSEQYRIDYNKA